MEVKLIFPFRIVEKNSRKKTKIFFIKSSSFRKKITNKLEGLIDIKDLYLSKNTELNNLAYLIKEISELPIPILPSYLNDIEKGNTVFIENELEPIYLDLFIQNIEDCLLEDIATSVLSSRIKESPTFLADQSGGLFGNFYDLKGFNFRMSENIFSIQQAIAFIDRSKFDLPDKDRLMYEAEEIFKGIFAEIKFNPN